MASGHMPLHTEEVEEMLLEDIPESPSSNTKPRHWYFAGAGLALLVVLGVAAKVVYRSPETLLQSKHFDMATVQEWEEIPGIEKVVEHAKTLELKQPLRNLNDLFKTASQSVLKSQSSFTAAPTVAISPKLAINAVKSPTQSAPEFTA
mmetsp:Transcript_3615/g.4034  ORF Transcript_3615/g.4034 Transcript_3615/m.4034 type:complete len:148 (+) Transcript_3615:91-534(+)